MNLFNRATNPLVSGVSERLGGGPIPYHEIAPINPITSDVTPQGWGEKMVSGALAGTAAGLEMGGIGRAVYGGARAAVPFVGNLVSEVGRLGREAFTSGTVPGAAAGAADEATQSQSPKTRQLVQLGTGAVSAVLAHKAMGEGNEFEAVAGRLGDSNNAETAGQAAQDAVRSWKVNEMPQLLAHAAAPLDAKMAHNPDVDLTNLDQTLHDMVTKAGAAQPLSNVIVSKLPSQLIQARAGIGPTIPYFDARQFRSDLGDLTANPKLIPGNDVNKVKALYGALSKDIGASAAANGAGDEWAAFNAASNQTYKTAEGPLSKIVSDVNPANDQIKPESVATSLWNQGKKGSSDLTALRATVPEAADEIAAGFLRSNPEKWAKLPDESKEALVPNPWDRAALDRASPTPSSPIERLQHTTGEPIAGSLIGEHGAELANHLLGHTFVDPSLAALSTALAPTAARFGRNLLSNPESIKIPLRGTIAASAINPLVTEEEKRQR